MGTGRVVAVSGLAVVFVLGASGVAYACEDPSPAFPREITEGENRFSIANIENGASWEVLIDGEVVDSGIDDDASEQGYTGSFTVPDLGSEKNVEIRLSVEHDGQMMNGSANISAPASYQPREAPTDVPGDSPDHGGREAPKANKPEGSSHGGATGGKEVTPPPAPVGGPAPTTASGSTPRPYDGSPNDGRDATGVRGGQAARSTEGSHVLRSIVEPSTLFGSQAETIDMGDRASAAPGDDRVAWWLLAVVIGLLVLLYLGRARRTPPALVAVIARGDAETDGERRAA